jgi:hypothetical protein
MSENTVRASCLSKIFDEDGHIFGKTSILSEEVVGGGYPKNSDDYPNTRESS